MIRHALTIAGAAIALTGCSRNMVMQGEKALSKEEAWVNAACSPVHPDFSTWTRRQVAGVTIAVPPGWIIEQGPPTNISIRNESRRTYGVFGIHERHEARQNYDLLFYRRQQYRNVCRGNLSGYPADVIATFHQGKYSLFAFWQAEWGGKDAGKWLAASITSSRLEEASELRALLHTVRPAEPSK